MRSCTGALSQLPADAELGAALKRFEALVSVVNRTLAEASRYYAREEYRRDDFRRGRELHTKLSDILAGLDDASLAFRPPFVAWLQDGEPRAESSDAGASKLPRAAVDGARWLALALLARPRDVEAERRALGAAEGALVRLSAAKAPNRDDERMTRQLEALIGVARELVAAEGKLSPRQRYRISSAMIAVLRNVHRAQMRALGGVDDPLGRLPRISPARVSPSVRRPTPLPRPR